MAAGDNMMDLALQITADPTQAQAAIEEFAGQVKNLGAATQAQAESYAAAGKAAQEAGQSEVGSAAAVTSSLQEELAAQGFVKDAWMQNAAAAREHAASAQAASSEAVSAAEAEGSAVDALTEHYTNFGSVASAQIDAVIADSANIGVAIGAGLGEGGAATQSFGGMLRSNLGDLQALRRAFYSVFFFSAALYMIPQMEKIFTEIQRLSFAVAGFGTAAQDAFAQAGKAYEQFMEHLKGADYTRALLQDVQKGAVQILSQIASTKSEIHSTMQDILHGVPGSSDILVGLREQLKQLEGQQIENSAQEEKLSLQLAKETTGHHKAAKTVKEHASAVDKLAQAEARAAEAIATAQVKLPPYIAEIERLQKALLLPEGKENNTLFAYAEENAQRLQEGLKPLEASLKQLGIDLPKLSMPGQPGGLALQIQQVTQLTEAERDRLPTERELALANAELAREYPNLTNAERAEWAQVMLTSQAYRQHIDEASRVKSKNAELASSFRSLATQARTAFSEMAGELTGWGGVATRVFDQVFNSVTQQIEIERRQAAEHQISQFSMAKATIDGLKQLAPVKAIIDTAKGIEALASWDFGAAAEWFAAAALWGTVGAFQIASMAGAFSPSSKGTAKAVTAATSPSGSSAAAGKDHTLASGSASAAAAGANDQQTVQVIFQGPVYGGSAGVNELISKIAGAVKFNGAYLPATHTVTGRRLS